MVFWLLLLLRLDLLLVPLLLLLLLGELLLMLGDEHSLLLLGVPPQRHARHPGVDQLDAGVPAHRDHSLLVVLLQPLLQQMLLLELLLKLKLLLVLQLLFPLAPVKIVHVDSDVDELESRAVPVEVD